MLKDKSYSEYNKNYENTAAIVDGANIFLKSMYPKIFLRCRLSFSSNDTYQRNLVKVILFKDIVEKR